MNINKLNPFEIIFENFVKSFGGTALSALRRNKSLKSLQTLKKEADYLFSKYDIVAELKCLQTDQTKEMQNKATVLYNEWTSMQRRVPSQQGDNSVGPADVPKEIQDKMAKALIRPIENILRDAHRQIRDTKEQCGLTSARGIVLIFNEANSFHNRPQDFAKLLALVLQKRTQNKTPRFPHIHGVIFFSAEQTITTFDEITERSMPFWCAWQVGGKDVEDVKRFQADLRDAWYLYVSKESNRPVRRHTREMKWD